MIFKDKYFFLSTFAPCSIQLNIEGRIINFNNAEAAFQGSKNPDLAEKFSLLSGLEAKKLGEKIIPKIDN